MVEDGNVILTTCWVLGSIATITMGARLYVRLVCQRNLWWDDYFIILTWLLAITSAILVIFAVHYGLGSDIHTLKDPENAVKFLTIAANPSIMSVAFGKVSVVFLLHRLMGTTMSRTHFWILWTLMFLSISIGAISVGLVLGLCYPAEAIWNKDVDGSCIDPNTQMIVGVAQSTYNAFTDLVLAAFPAWIFWKLNMTLRRKIGLTMLLGVGIFASVVSCYKGYQLRNLLSHANLTLSWAPITIWNSVEMFVLIVTANIPTLRPLFRSILGGRSSANSYPNSYPLGFVPTTSKKNSKNTAGGSGFGRISDKEMGYVTCTDAADNTSLHPTAGTSQDGESANPSLNSTIVKTTDFTASYEHPPRLE